MKTIFKDDLFGHQPSRIVAASCERLGALYDVQANPREINLFYLQGDIRERIERKGDGFGVCNTSLYFSSEEMKRELVEHPERFSPNVILRGIYQETILPNIAFIGGGGELAYWLQLKDLFINYAVPFPALVLRNSFLLVDKKSHALMQKLGLQATDLFKTELEIMNSLVEREGKKPQLNGEVAELKAIYETLKQTAAKTDATLGAHVAALQTRTLNDLAALEKKMLKAERKKMEAVQRQVARLKNGLFPRHGLQERVENISGYYASFGSAIIDKLWEHSAAIEPSFTVLTEI
jgi:bacillithiol biosynthesis cysteine-adding enzyme BshC